jgi:hypothetical protein
MFDTPLEELINRKHLLVVLSKMIPPTSIRVVKNHFLRNFSLPLYL